MFDSSLKPENEERRKEKTHKCRNIGIWHMIPKGSLEDIHTSSDALRELRVPP